MSNVIKVISSVVALSVTLNACQAKDTPPAEKRVPDMIEVEVNEPLTRQNAMLAAFDGQAFSIILDKCPQSDEGYVSGEPDFLGTVKCGETYSGTYDSANGEYTVTGLNEGSGSEYAATFKGPTPTDNVVSIWGGIFAVDEAFNAKASVNGEFVTVGTFALSE